LPIFSQASWLGATGGNGAPGRDGYVGAPAVAHRLPAHASAGAGVLPCGVGGHAGRHAVAHRQDVLARRAYGADGVRDTEAQPRPGPWAVAGGASAAVAGGDGDCGRCGVTMTYLTPDRLQELRRIAEAAPQGPWVWREDRRGKILDLFGYGEEIVTPSLFNASLKVKGGFKEYIQAFDPTT